MYTLDMEQLQEGYVAAVAATAGVEAEFPGGDRNKYDVELKRQDSTDVDEVNVRLQLKATGTARFMNSKDPSVGRCLSYQFQALDDFEALTMAGRTIKHLLVVMIVGPEQHAWTEATEDHLKTRKCCYWVNMEGEQARPGVLRPTVHLPVSQVFDADAITGILDRIERGQRI